VEIARKLVLCSAGRLVGAERPVFVTGLTLVLSLAFHWLQLHYRPYRRLASNRLANTSQLVLNLLLLIGLLCLYQEEVASRNSDGFDESSLGRLMIFLTYSVIALAVCTVCGRAALLYRYCEGVRALARELRSLPRQDPPDGSDAFYLVQNPVKPVEPTEVFTPRLPPIAGVTAEQKLATVEQLCSANTQFLDRFFTAVDENESFPLRRVPRSTDVSGPQDIYMRHNRKTEELILAKASRPCLRARHALFVIEHLRDTFRFKGVVGSFGGALWFVRAISRLFFSGLSARNVVKLDVEKLLEPKEWGWRFVAFDLRMPSHQIIEC
jgi:hypothetical protein